MALSNWDTLALNEKGESIGGAFRSPLGVVVRFYKNWIYVNDAKAWVEGGRFVQDTIMEVRSGDFHYKDVQVLAVRGPQDGIYAAVYTTVYEKPSDGCDKCKVARGKHHAAGCVDKIETYVLGMVGCGVYGYNGDEWVGVDAESKLFLAEWIMNEDSELPDDLRNVDLSKALRFNQGDAFFAERLGQEIPATLPGQAQPSVLSQAFQRKP